MFGIVPTWTGSVLRSDELQAIQLPHTRTGYSTGNFAGVCVCVLSKFNKLIKLFLNLRLSISSVLLLSVS